MKKFAVLALFFLSILLIAGCQSENGMKVSVEVISIQGKTLLEEEVSYDDPEISLLDLLDQEVDLDYEMSQYGAFIKGVGKHYPREFGVTYNYWFSLYIDDEMSMTGLDQVELRDGMKISFIESTMLDDIDLWVDDMIISFIESHLDDYINEASFETYVGLAYHHLSLFNTSYKPLKDHVTPARPDADNLSGIYQNIVLDRIFNVNDETHQLAMEAQNVDNVYFAMTQLIGLMMTSSTSDKIEELVELLTTTSPDFMDADYAGMLLQQLSFESISGLNGVETKIEDMLDYIDEHITAEGMVAYGTANASSTAQVILGLVAQGIDPRSEGYQVSGVDLIESLQTFQIESLFKYTLSSETADLGFSTPQAFAALVMYKIYRDTFQNPSVLLYQVV